MRKEKDSGKPERAQKSRAAKEKPELFLCSECRLPKTRDDFYQSPTRGRKNQATEGIGKRCKSCEKNAVIRQNYRKILSNQGINSLIALRDRHRQLVTIIESVIGEAEGQKR